MSDVVSIYSTIKNINQNSKLKKQIKLKFENPMFKAVSKV